MSKEKLFEMVLPIEDYQELKASYRRNDLWQEWHRKHPALFSDNDCETLANQARTGHHFHEFLSAVLLLEHKGLLSLVEKYQHCDHKEKHRVIGQIGSPELEGAMTYILTEVSPRYGPDLIVFSNDFSIWFFCEVKGPDDDMDDEQKQDCKKLGEITGKPVRLMKFRKDGKQMLIVLWENFESGYDQ